MDLNTKKEQFSRAYVKAISSVAGFAYDDKQIDRDSVDVMFSSVTTPFPRIEAQLKSTADNTIIQEEHIHYPLSIKNYNDLRANPLVVPRILICLLLPEDNNAQTDMWIRQTPESLLIMKCAYWISLKDFPETQNTTSVTIKIPLTNIFSPEALRLLMTDCANSVSRVGS